MFPKQIQIDKENAAVAGDDVQSAVLRTAQSIADSHSHIASTLEGMHSDTADTKPAIQEYAKASQTSSSSWQAAPSWSAPGQAVPSQHEGRLLRCQLPRKRGSKVNKKQWGKDGWTSKPDLRKEWWRRDEHRHDDDDEELT